MLPAVILCGGLSTRLQLYTVDIPKSMINVAGKPFIHYQLSLLKENGAEKVILCIGKHGDKIWDYVQDGLKWGLSVKYSDDGGELLGTGGAVRNALSVLPEEFIVMNGDSYLDFPYAPAVEKFQQSGKQMLMTIYPVSGVTNHNGNVVVKDGQIVEYDKSGSNPEINYVDYGLTAMKKRVLYQFPAGEPFDFGKIYSRCIHHNAVTCYRSPQVFHEIGSYEGLEATSRYIQSKDEVIF